MLKVFILVVVTHVYGGETISFQEFSSLKSCQSNANYIKQFGDVTKAYCTEK